jgi:aryl-alcohol dehydrogenase-like predicted oxidoreductase
MGSDPNQAGLSRKHIFHAIDEKVVEGVRTVAAAHGVPPAQIALAWMLHKPWITAPIVGASKPRHLEDTLAALNLKLAPEEIARLEEPYVPHAVMGHE